MESKTPMAKTLYLVRGLPGSGKTTLARRLCAGHNLPSWVAVFEADQYFEAETATGTVYTFDPSKLPHAHADCQRRVAEYLAEPLNDVCFVANTFCRQWEIQPYRQLAHAYGYQVVEIVVKTGLTDAELAQRNLHGCPEDVIARRRAVWEP